MRLTYACSLGNCRTDGPPGYLGQKLSAWTTELRLPARGTDALSVASSWSVHTPRSWARSAWAEVGEAAESGQPPRPGPTASVDDGAGGGVGTSGSACLRAQDGCAALGGGQARGATAWRGASAWLSTEGARKEELPERRADTRRVAQKLGLMLPLGERRGDEWIGGKPRADAVAAVQALRADIARRRDEITDSDRQRTAMRRFDAFVQETDRVPFCDPHAPGGKLYNQETLDMFAVYLRQCGNQRRGSEGEPISGSYIMSLVGAVRIYTERLQRELITSKDDNLIAGLLAKHFRRADAGRRSSGG